MFNPFHIPFDFSTLCITAEEYYSIFDHLLGADCIEGTADDPHAEENPEFERVETAEECPEGTTFMESACACY